MTPALSAQCSNRLSYRPLSIVPSLQASLHCQLSVVLTVLPICLGRSLWLPHWQFLSALCVGQFFRGVYPHAASHPANASSGTLTAEEWQDNLLSMFQSCFGCLLCFPVALCSPRFTVSCQTAGFPHRFLCSPFSLADGFASALGVEHYALRFGTVGSLLQQLLSRFRSSRSLV